jgi:hypothetical protein
MNIHPTHAWRTPWSGEWPRVHRRRLRIVFAPPAESSHRRPPGELLMRTKPLSYKGGSPPPGQAAANTRGMGAAVAQAREAFPPTLFFFIGFNFIVLTTNLLAAQYLVAGSNFMLATMAALVVGAFAL